MGTEEEEEDDLVTIRPTYPCAHCRKPVPHNYNLRYGFVYVCDECAESMKQNTPREVKSPKSRSKKCIGGPLTVSVYHRWELENNNVQRTGVFEGIRKVLREHLKESGQACFLYSFSKLLAYGSPQERYNYARHAVEHSGNEFELQKINERVYIVKI